MNDLLANFLRVLITALIFLCSLSVWCVDLRESVNDSVIQTLDLDRENLITIPVKDATSLPLIRIVNQQGLPSTSLTSTFSRMIEQVVVDKVIETVVPVPQFVPLAERIGNGLYIKLDDSWQAEVRSSVLAVLHESADAIYSHMKDRPLIEVTVTYDLEEGPIALYRTQGESADTVLLSATPQDYRPQLMYQFAHEFCHVISDHNRLRSTESANQWLHESFCELASIFVLHSTLEDELRSYVDDYRAESIEILDSLKDFPTWLSEKEDELRGNTPNHDRVSNAVVAYRLLPVFKQFPEIWNTFPLLPNSESLLADYLDEWQESVADDDKKLIALIRATLLNQLLPSESDD
ncbi:MAG: hypothetical protein OXG88_09995 [Gammaproteobacteria bacterium]|nr:hypothetical protein [Gammaproteobacteria bacterium]